jgi:hypothetical protein
MNWGCGKMKREADGEVSDQGRVAGADVARPRQAQSPPHRDNNATRIEKENKEKETNIDAVRTKEAGTASNFSCSHH